VYIVKSARVVEPDEVDVLKPTAQPALTLITCYPFRYIGPAPERFVVRAVLAP
jgi:sortase A